MTIRSRAPGARRWRKLVWMNPKPVRWHQGIQSNVMKWSNCTSFKCPKISSTYLSSAKSSIPTTPAVCFAIFCNMQYFPYLLLLSKTYQKLELVEYNDIFEHGVLRMYQTNMRSEDNLGAVKNYNYPFIGFNLHRCAGCHVRLEAGWSVWNSVRSS